MEQIREVYNRNFTNAAITPGAIYPIQDTTALQLNKLPFNKLRMANQSATIIHVYLDDPNKASPDYVLGVNQIIDEGVEEGVQYNFVFLKNTDGASNTAANTISVRCATAWPINEQRGQNGPVIPGRF